MKHPCSTGNAHTNMLTDWPTFKKKKRKQKKTKKHSLPELKLGLKSEDYN